MDCPITCQLCEKPLVGHWVDGKTQYGPWANMCPRCHAKLGLGLGTGLGQEYKAGADGTARKIAG